MKAVFLDFATMGPGLDVSALRAALPEVEIFDVTTDDQVAERIAGAEIVLGNKQKISAEMMRQNPQIRYIGLTATGTDNIDLAAARENSIAVCNIRGYCTQSVAEHVIGCLLNLTRSLQQFNAAVRAGEWQESEDFCLLTFPIRELSAMTMGVVGYGNLGGGVAKVAKSFGMEVIVSARPGGDSIAEDRVPFEHLLQQADVISLHCPLTDETEGLFGENEFRRMKSDAILINTARGGLVNSAALVAALTNGEIAAAAIDVLPQEPPVNGDPLLDYELPNLMITPHIAWATNEARQASIDQLVACISAFLEGGKVNRVD
jgi:glycerate dehydrogenase